LDNEAGGRRETVLFICNHNAGRSQMAEALLRRFHGDRYETFSAATDPKPVNPYVVRVLSEQGIDISTARSKSIEEFRGRTFDQVVTLCDRARDTCPFFPGGKRFLHRVFPNPSSFKGTDGEVLAGVRSVRDGIRAWLVEAFGPETN
jgi:arsenate reductase (thioredoxin)